MSFWILISTTAAWSFWSMVSRPTRPTSIPNIFTELPTLRPLTVVNRAKREYALSPNKETWPSFTAIYPIQSSPKTRKMPTVVSTAYLFICVPPHVAPKAGNFFLLMFCRIDNGIDFPNRLPLGNSGQDGKFDALLRSRLFATSSPNASNSLPLEIIDNILQHAFHLSRIRIGEHRNKFIGVAAGGKAPYGTKVFIDIYAHAPSCL